MRTALPTLPSPSRSLVTPSQEDIKLHQPNLATRKELPILVFSMKCQWKIPRLHQADLSTLPYEDTALQKCLVAVGSKNKPEYMSMGYGVYR